MLETKLRQLTLLGFALSACVDRTVWFDDSGLPVAPSPEPQGAGGSMSRAGAASAGVGSTPPEPPGGGAAGASGGSPEPPGGHAGAPEGGASEAGAAGAVGEAGAPPVPPTPTLDFIDEVEVGFPLLPLRAGRSGAWFGVHDTSGGFAPEPSALELVPARGASQRAAHLAGGGFTAWGAQLGVSLQASVTGYDASLHCGLHFVAKGSGAGWSLLVSDRLSSPSGGVCEPDANEPSRRCYDHLGKSFSPSDVWQTFDVSFDELRPFKGFTEVQRPLQKAALFDIVFNFESPNGAPFEILVDDLAFVPCAPP